MQRSAIAKLTIRNLETDIEWNRDDFIRITMTSKLPTTEAHETNQAATRSQVAPKMSSHGLVFDE